MKPGERREKRLKHPMQPVYMDDAGTYRFKSNKIIQYLFDKGKIDLNLLSLMQFDAADRTQIAMLLGYSISGAGDLSYFDENIWKKADKRADQLASKRTP